MISRQLQALIINARYAFRPRKPELLLRLANTVLRTSVLKQSRLRYVDFSIGYGCNLRCQHCFASVLTRPGRQRMMDVDDYARVAREAMALGAVNFSFQGGEPLLFSKLPDYIKACQPQRNVISVTTNGTLIDERRVEDLRRWGVDILTISLDSSIAEEHDSFRGVSGTYEKTIKAIRLALHRGLNVTIGSVVTHQTLRSPGIAGLVELANELRCLLYFIYPVPAGRWKHQDDEMLLTAEDNAYIQALTRQTPFVRTDLQANLGGFGCGAVKEILYLTPYGDVLPCPFMHISMGNVFQEGVAAIRGRGLKNGYFADYHPNCLVSNDRKFIDERLSVTFDAENLPVPWDDAFPPEEGGAT